MLDKATAIDETISHFYEVAIIAALEYTNEPSPEYLRQKISKKDRNELADMSAYWAADAGQFRRPGDLNADILDFKEQLLQDDVLEAVATGTFERAFGRFNERYLRKSPQQHEHILEQARRSNDLMVRRGGAVHAFLSMDETAYRYILNAAREECDVAGQSGLTINFHEAAELILFQSGCYAREHFLNLALAAAQEHVSGACSDHLADRTQNPSARCLHAFAVLLSANHVNGCKPQGLSAGVAYFRACFLAHDILDAIAYERLESISTLVQSIYIKPLSDESAGKRQTRIGKMVPTTLFSV